MIKIDESEFFMRYYIHLCWRLSLFCMNTLYIYRIFSMSLRFETLLFIITFLHLLSAISMYKMGEKETFLKKNSKCWTHWCINKFQGDTIHENTVSRKSTSNKRGVSCCSLSAKYRLAKFVLWSILQLTSQIEEFLESRIYIIDRQVICEPKYSEGIQGFKIYLVFIFNFIFILPK